MQYTIINTTTETQNATAYSEEEKYYNVFGSYKNYNFEIKFNRNKEQHIETDIYYILIEKNNPTTPQSAVYIPFDEGFNKDQDHKKSYNKIFQALLTEFNMKYSNNQI